jgi:nitrate/nitrite transporter NarK
LWGTTIKKKVSTGRKLAFASADLFGGGSFNIINFLYPGFLALVVGINPFWSGFIILVSRVFDALIDPFIGWLSDQTQSRFGKRRVYLIFMSPLIVLGMFLVFYPYQFEDELARVGAVLVSYLALSPFNLRSWYHIPRYLEKFLPIISNGHRLTPIAVPSVSFPQFYVWSCQGLLSEALTRH